MELKNFLIGSLLGDGAFIQKTINHNTYAVFKHCEDQYEYLNWKFQYLSHHGLIREKSKGITKVIIKPGSCFGNYQQQYKFATKSSKDLNFIKALTEKDILSAFNKEILAVWILDDGSVGKSKNVKVSCGTKSLDFCKSIVDKINSEFGLEAYLYQHPVNSMKNSINFRASSYEDVKRMMLNYFPADLDIMVSKFNTDVDVNALKIQIKYFSDTITPLTYVGGDITSNWIDLRAAETVEMKAGEFKLIPLGVAMKLPRGYEAHVVPRSSTFKNFGIIQTNHCGIIDGSYCGPNDQWFFPAYAVRDTVINVNDRICQFRIMTNQPRIDFYESDLEDNANRGGHGSTGTN